MGRLFSRVPTSRDSSPVDKNGFSRSCDLIPWSYFLSFPPSTFQSTKIKRRKVDKVILKIFCVEILSESSRSYFHGTIKSFQAKFDGIYCPALKFMFFKTSTVSIILRANSEVDWPHTLDLTSTKHSPSCPLEQGECECHWITVSSLKYHMASCHINEPEMASELLMCPL